MSVAGHQSAGCFTIGQEENSGRQLAALGGLALDLGHTLLASEAHTVAIFQTEPRHVIRANKHRAYLVNVFALKFANVQGCSLARRSTGYEDKSFTRHVVVNYSNRRPLGSFIEQRFQMELDAFCQGPKVITALKATDDSSPGMDLRNLQNQFGQSREVFAL